MENIYDCVKCHACCLPMPILWYDNEYTMQLEKPLWEFRGFKIEKLDNHWVVLAPQCKYLLENGKCALWDKPERPKACDIYLAGCDRCKIMRDIKEKRG